MAGGPGASREPLRALRAPSGAPEASDERPRDPLEPFDGFRKLGLGTVLCLAILITQESLQLGLKSLTNLCFRSCPDFYPDR